MTEFVQRTFAANIRLNNAPIERVSMPSNQVQSSHVPNPFFIHRTSARQTTTPTPLIANPRAPRVDDMDLFKDLSSKLAHPTSSRRELDKRMQLFKESQKFEFLQNKRYPATIGLMIGYIIDLLKVKRPTATQAPTSSTLESMEASKRYRQFFQEGNLHFEFPPEFNELAELDSKSILSFPGRSVLLLRRSEASLPHSSALLL
jgi:hypothetical protein